MYFFEIPIIKNLAAEQLIYHFSRSAKVIGHQAISY